jgi:hypothetical protein
MSVVALVILLSIAGLVVCLANYAIIFPRQPFRGEQPPPSADELDLAPRLRRHITAIASKPHNIAYYANLEAAAQYIERTLASFGFEPRTQIYEVEERDVRNIEVVIEPDGGAADATYVIGAHYDSPDDSPGANDNGTGVAALLELARLLAGARPARHRLRLVFFVNEEQPYSWTEAMGSWRYAKGLADAGETVHGMIALETIGYFSNEAESQTFPWPFGLIYPKVGNFVAFVGLPGSRRFLGRALGTFRRTTPFPSIGGVAPSFLEDVGRSDHWSFHQFGYPAVMLTDTAPFRNPYYHRLNDLPKNVDYASLARVTLGLEAIARALAFGEEPAAMPR